MNTILFLSLLTAPFCKNDTIVSIERPDSVVITQESGTTRIHVYGRKDDPEYQYDLKQTETPSTCRWLGFQHTLHKSKPPHRPYHIQAQLK